MSHTSETRIFGLSLNPSKEVNEPQITQNQADPFIAEAERFEALRRIQAPTLLEQCHDFLDAIRGLRKPTTGQKVAGVGLSLAIIAAGSLPLIFAYADRTPNNHQRWAHLQYLQTPPQNRLTIQTKGTAPCLYHPNIDEKVSNNVKERFPAGTTLEVIDYKGSRFFWIFNPDCFIDKIDARVVPPRK